MGTLDPNPRNQPSIPHWMKTTTDSGKEEGVDALNSDDTFTATDRWDNLHIASVRVFDDESLQDVMQVLVLLPVLAADFVYRCIRAFGPVRISGLLRKTRQRDLRTSHCHHSEQQAAQTILIVCTSHRWLKPIRARYAFVAALVICLARSLLHHVH